MRLWCSKGSIPGGFLGSRFKPTQAINNVLKCNLQSNRADILNGGFKEQNSPRDFLSDDIAQHLMSFPGIASLWYVVFNLLQRNSFHLKIRLLKHHSGILSIKEKLNNDELTLSSFVSRETKTSAIHGEAIRVLKMSRGGERTEHSLFI